MGESSSVAMPARSMRMKVGGAMFCAGGVLGWLGAALPPPAEGSEAVVAAIGTASFVGGVAMLATRRRLPEWALGVLIALGSLAITVATSEGGTGTGTEDNEMLYVWIALYSFYFFSLPHALGQMGIVGGLYAALLASQPLALGPAVTSWIVTMTTLLLGGVVVSLLRRSVRQLVNELTDRARVDALTGLLNREGLEQRAALELARARRDESPLTVMVTDIDGFKTINDTLGHAAGDRALQSIAAAFAAETRTVDAVARIGGDEFTVLLPATDEATATTVAHRLLAAVRKAGVEDGDLPPLRVSIGLAIGRGGIESLESLWQAADRAMYAAKREGGNTVAVADEAEITITATTPGSAAPTMSACPPAAS